MLLYTILKDKQKTAGKTTLTNMLKSGKELKVFSVKANEFENFTQEAKRYGVLYSALINKKDKHLDGVVDIMVRAEDAAKINRIVERFKLSSYEEATIRSEIEKTRKSKNKNMKKDESSLNPRLAKTEKSPLLEPSLEMQNNSNQGTEIIKKPSVKHKLEKIKEDVKMRDNKSERKFEVKTNEHKHPKKKKVKEK